MLDVGGEHAVTRVLLDRDFVDGERFKNNPLFAENNCSLQIQLYYDELKAQNTYTACRCEFCLCVFIQG